MGAEVAQAARKAREAGLVAVWPEISVETAKFPNEPNRAASQAKNRFCQPL